MHQNPYRFRSSGLAPVCEPLTEILLVDDEIDLLESVERLLKSAGYRVLTANCAQEAIELMETHPPQLVLADIIMPGVNGLDLLHAIRTNPSTSRIQVIFLTVLADQKTIREAIEIGVDDFLTKPALRQEILRAVANRLERAGL